MPVVAAASKDDPSVAMVGFLPKDGYTSPVTVTIKLEDVGGPSAGLMFTLGIIDKLTAGQQNGGAARRRHRDDRRERQGRRHRRDPAEDGRRPGRRRHRLPRPGRQLRRGAARGPSRAAAGEGHRPWTTRCPGWPRPSPAGRAPHLFGLNAAGLTGPVRARGSRPAPRPGLAPGPAPVSTASALVVRRGRAARSRRVPSRSTATTSRTSSRSGWSASDGRAPPPGPPAGRPRPTAAADALDDERGPGHRRRGQRQPASSSSSVRGPAAPPARPGVTRLAPRGGPEHARPAPARAPAARAVGTRANSRGGWSQPAPATCSSISRTTAPAGAVMTHILTYPRPARRGALRPARYVVRVSFNLPPDPDEPAARRRVRCRRVRRAAVRCCSRSCVLALLVIVFWIFTGLLHRPAVVPLGRHGTSRWCSSTELKTRLLLFVVFGGLMAAAVAVELLAGLPAPAGVPRDLRRAAGPGPLPGRASTRTAGSLVIVVAARARPDRRRLGGRPSGRPALAFFNSAAVRQQGRAVRLDCPSSCSGCRSGGSCSASGSASCVRVAARGAVVHYLYGGLRLQTPGDKTTPAARAHLAVLLGLFVLLKAVAYWLDRYGLVVKDGAADQRRHVHRRQRGAAGQADPVLHRDHLRAAVLRHRRDADWLAPALGFGLLVLSAVVIGGIYPVFVQSFQVKPSEPDKEAPYIQRNIDATRQGVRARHAIESQDYAGATDPQGRRRRRRCRPCANVRLLDPAVVSPTFKQLQQVRGFYSFADTLDVDRYTLDGVDGSDRRARGRRRGPRAQPRRPAGQPAQLDQRPHRLHPRLRLRRRLRQHQRQRRQARRSSSTTSRRRGRSTITPAADLLRRELARTTRSSARRAASSRSSSTTRPTTASRAVNTYDRQGRRADRLALRPAAVRGEVRRAEHPAVRPRSTPTRKILYNRDPRDRVRRSRRG